mmetsp:Transcript_84598/g.167976  ORF Transcript_84598/g.167976 Transcript_84598/m.167976 type:complete len:202 (-) Transcript_84598:706-1311(-)
MRRTEIPPGAVGRSCRIAVAPPVAVTTKVPTRALCPEASYHSRRGRRILASLSPALPWHLPSLMRWPAGPGFLYQLLCAGGFLISHRQDTAAGAVPTPCVVEAFRSAVPSILDKLVSLPPLPVSFSGSSRDERLRLHTAYSESAAVVLAQFVFVRNFSAQVSLPLSQCLLNYPRMLQFHHRCPLSTAPRDVPPSFWHSPTV